MKTLLTLLLLSATAAAQVPSPTGGALGQAGSFPFRYGVAVTMTDADYSLTYPQTAAGFIKFSGTLTATRNITGFPTCNISNINFEIDIENSTAQTLELASVVPVLAGQSGGARCDGTNYISSGGGSSAGVSSINSTTGAFTFTGSGVSCASTTCTFTSASSLAWSAITGGTNSTGNVMLMSGSSSIQAVSGSGGVVEANLFGDTGGAIAFRYGAASSAAGYTLCVDPTNVFLKFCPAGGGTVTSFTAGNLAPLFTTSVATSTTTPALTFTLSNAAQNSVLAGPATGGAGAPSYQTAPTISAANMTSFPTLNQNTTGTAANVTGTVAIANGGLGGTTAPSAGMIWIAQSATVASPETMSGSCTLGSTGVITCGPPERWDPYNLAVADGGAAFCTGFCRYDNNQPTIGAIAPATSSSGYMSWPATYVSPQYAEATLLMPPYWTGTDFYFGFYSTSTSGSAVMDVQTACIPIGTNISTPTWSTAIPFTTALPGTAGNTAQSAIQTNIATPGAGVCPSTPTTPSLLKVRIFGDSTNTVPIYGLYVEIGKKESQ